MTGLHPIVKLAREAVETYIREGKALQPRELSPEMKGRAGLFVSIKNFGELRGCIGTFSPTRKNIAEEVVHNAIASATQDPRFLPVAGEELPHLEYSVDILTSPDPVAGPEELDPRGYGCIVECGRRRGLPPPALEGGGTGE